MLGEPVASQPACCCANLATELQELRAEFRPLKEVISRPSSHPRVEHLTAVHSRRSDSGAKLH